MSTFEKAKNNLIREMQMSKAHTSESWTRIMLKHTSRLTKEEDQKKMWAFICNPTEDEDMPVPVFETVPEQPEDVPARYTVTIPATGDEEKEREVVMENVCMRNGTGMYIYTKPVTTESLASSLSQVCLDSKCEEKVDQTA
jgi:hypothetical protein